MTAHGTTDQEPDSGYSRLESQIRWYDQKSGSAQKLFKRLKMIEIIFTAGIPIVAPFHGIAAAVIGGLILVFEALQHINQWQHNWITYRSTCEALRHEKYTFLGRAGVYDGLNEEQAKKTLVQRTEALISTEHSKWISRQEYDPARAKKESQMDNA